MAALIQAPRTASARTLSESHIAVISGETLRGVLRESDEVSLFMLKEFSQRIRHTNENLEELTRSLLRLTATLFFLRSWPLPADRDPLDDLSRAADRDAAELQEVIEELGRRGVLTLSDGRVTGFNREEAWKLLDEHVSP
jgi:CRP-like cAMP-binding protein